MITTQSVERFRILTVNELQLPHKCGICGSFTDRRKYIFFDFFVEFYGNLYICTECFRGAADLVSEPCNHEQLLEELRAVVASLLIENKELRENADSLRSRLLSRSDSNPNGHSHPTPEITETESGDSNVDETSGEGEDRENRSHEQIDVRGPEDVHSNDSKGLGSLFGGGIGI